MNCFLKLVMLALLVSVLAAVIETLLKPLLLPAGIILTLVVLFKLL